MKNDFLKLLGLFFSSFEERIDCMRSILSKIDQRHLLILESLFDSEFLTLEKLSKITNTSKRNVQNDVQSINSYISPMEIYSSLKKGYYLSYPSNYSIDFIYRCTLKKSLEYTLIEMIFFEKWKNLEDYAESMYLSLSTLKRMINKINQEEEKLGFKISIGPIKLIGDEKKICSFMTTFFTEAYENEHFPFPRIQIKALTKIINIVDSNNMQELNYPDKYWLKVIIMVSIIRLQNGHHTKLGPINLEPFQLAITHNFFIKRLFKTIFKLQLTEEVLYRLLYPFINKNFSTDYDSLIELTKESPSVNKKFMTVKTFLKDLSIIFDISLENRQLLTLELYNTFQMMYRENYIIYNKKAIFIKAFTQGNSYLSDIIYSSIQKALSLKKDLKQFELEELAYILITHWPNFATKIQKLKVIYSVGVFMDSDIEHTQFIASTLAHKYANDLDFKVLSSKTIDQFLVDSKNYEFVVTNISGLTNNETTFICIEFFPSTKDYTNISELLSKLQKP